MTWARNLGWSSRLNPKDNKDRDSSQRFVEGSDRGIAMVAMDFGQARRNPSYTSLLFGKESGKLATSRTFAFMLS